ncbi:hypothetical protein GCK32_008593 [Trichostrongylus colubriformis]|uniref:P2X purinoreceptor 7 intracellular domain-containing protein n=1 Tax=Trichostrongylus colubriformis TaxID=6319 RepID=A0AAN8FB55_TRICO
MAREILCSIEVEDSDLELVQKVFKRIADREAREEAAKLERYCLLLGKELSMERLGNMKWCTCGSCVCFTTLRENICCQEARKRVEKSCSALAGLKEKMQVVKRCITQHPSFQKIALDPEVLRVLMCHSKFEKRKTKESPYNENETLRYCAYRAFVFWAYGPRGLNHRYELPACVRGAIMKAFPSNSADSIGVTSSLTFILQCNTYTSGVECDSEDWRRSVV